MAAAEQPLRMKSARHRRAMSAIARPNSSLRPMTATTPRRPYSAYTRKGSEDDSPKYDGPESNREWWRFYLKETPNPGSYQHKGFVDELHKRPSTYRFRDSSRVKSASHQRFERTGQWLMPGAYQHQDFLQQTAKKKATYNFRGTERNEGPKIGHGCGDKEIDTNPFMYDTVDYSEKEEEKDTKTSSYKSQVKRSLHSAPQFRIVKGPGPGQYDHSQHKPTEVTSVFRSKVARFPGRPSRTPGPGTYAWNDSPFGYPPSLPAVVHHLKKKHDITIS